MVIKMGPRKRACFFLEAESNSDSNSNSNSNSNSKILVRILLGWVGMGGYPGHAASTSL